MGILGTRMILNLKETAQNEFETPSDVHPLTAIRFVKSHSTVKIENGDSS